MITFPLYMDYQATTPVDPRVLQEMLPFFTERYGNPHAREHRYGWEAEEATEIARERIAALIGAESRDIIFTSGATESNNLAIKGVMRAFAGKKTHLITAATEHPCVLSASRALLREGCEVTVLPVDREGAIDLDRLDQAITGTTALVSLMAANNEMGALHPLAAIGALCRRRGVLFHTDAAQAFGKIPLNVETMQIDLMSLSAHKIYGPKGVGALYVRQRPKVRLVPLFDGGDQEKGVRPGTLPVPLCAGFGKAAEIAGASMQDEAERIGALGHRFLTRVLTLPGVYLNGPAEPRLPGNINLLIEGVEGGALVVALKKLAVSSGSACASGSREPSYVLQALGRTPDEARKSARFGIGRFSTMEEVDEAARIVHEHVTSLRSTYGDATYA